MKNYARINTVLLIVLLFISCVTCFLILRITHTSNNIFSGTVGEWNARKQLEFAETLANKGLKKEALVAFDDYLKNAKISAIEAAKLLYKMGNMHMDLLDYEKALYYFYKAETADPNAGFKSQLDEKLAECLKNLNVDANSSNDLIKETDSGDGINQESKGAVIAKVGNTEITEGEIDEAIKEIPDWAKENFNQGEGKVEFIRQYVTTQALYEKAKKTGLEQDAQVRRNIKDVTKKLLVQRLLEKELKEKIDISPSEIEAYYQENKGKYKEDPKAKLSVIKVSTQENAQDIMRRLEVGADFGKTAQELSEDESTKAQAGAIEGDIEKNGYIKGIDAPKEVLDLVFSKKEGEFVGPIEIKGSYYIFRVNSITSEKEKPFEEVKELVEYEYKNKKLQDEMQVLLKDVLQEEQVEIYTDKILKQDTQEDLKTEPEKTEEAK